MRHRVKKGKKLGRPKAQRSAMFNAMVGSLVEHEEIKTTEVKAKELSRIIEPFITRAKTSSLQTHRQLSRSLSARTVKKLVEEIAPRYKDRPGGYTRITRLTPRKKDGARMAKVELV